MLALIILAAIAVEQPTPSDAIDWAIVHQMQADEADRPFLRYLWISPDLPLDSLPSEDGKRWDERQIGGAISYAVNAAASKAGVVIPLDRIANGWMIVVDLRRLCPKPTELQRLIDVWDGLAKDDPYFHATKENAGGRVAVIPDHLSHHADFLAATSQNPSLVYRADWFLVQALHLKYYEFKQWTKVDGTLFDQQEVYATYGADEAKSKALNGDQRVGIFVSGVTKSVRRLDRIQGIGGRFNTGSIWQSFDTTSKDGKISSNPFYNLLAYNPVGGEAIIEEQNGLHSFVIFQVANDEKGSRPLQRVAPANLVTDFTIPDGHPAELVSAISCIRCHGSHGGLWPVRNDVATLVKSGTDIVADFSDPKLKLNEETIDRLAGLYMGNFDKRLLIGRSDYDEAVRRATFHIDSPQGIGVVENSRIVSAIYRQYVFDDVTPAVACRELGYLAGDDAAKTLRSILPPAEFRNPVVSALRAGIAVRRSDWEQVYSGARAQIVSRVDGEPADKPQ